MEKFRCLRTTCCTFSVKSAKTATHRTTLEVVIAVEAKEHTVKLMTSVGTPWSIVRRGMPAGDVG